MVIVCDKQTSRSEEAIARAGLQNQRKKERMLKSGWIEQARDRIWK
jgi:hypothetical protein